MQPKLVVIEGLDGSGKQAQARLLTERLNSNGIKARYISFPNYESKSASLVKMYLSGEISENSDDINAYASSIFFSCDRYITFLQDISPTVSEYDVLVCDRYTDSNAIYQMTKEEKKDWNEFTNWLYDLEYNRLLLPKPTLTVYLDVPVECSQELIKKRYNNDENRKDIHEKNVVFLRKCHNTAGYLSKKFNWNKVNCINKEKKLRAIEDINDEILNIVNKLF